MANILVTGASGFIGKHLVTKLKQNRDQVIEIKHTSLFDPTGLSIIENLKDIEYIYHLAAYGNMSHQKDETEIYNANINGVWNLLQATKRMPYKAFVNVSTSSVTLPYQTIYAATKKAGEALCNAFISEHHKPIVSVRPYSVYGIGEAPYRLIPTIFRSCITGEAMTLSEGTHDWVEVDDFVAYLIAISKTSGMVEMPSLYEFGSSIATTNQELVTMIETLTHKKANITDRKSLRSWDTREWKAKEKQTHIPIQIGLMKYYDSLKNEE